MDCESLPQLTVVVHPELDEESVASAIVAPLPRAVSGLTAGCGVIPFASAADLLIEVASFNSPMNCGELLTRGHAGFLDVDERDVRLRAAGGSLEKLNAPMPWEVFGSLWPRR